MGNSAGIELGDIQFYNTTPFVLTISVDHRQYVNEPWRNRLTAVDKVSSENRFVEVRAHDPDDRSRVLKTVSFLARRQQAWIISDAEVRRQMPGYPIYIADDWSTETFEDRKHYTWIPTATSSDDAETNVDLRSMIRSDDEYAVRDDVTDMSIVIFNDTPYFLDISVKSCPASAFSWNSFEKTDQVRFYRSEPRRQRQTADAERLVTLSTGGDRYPLVSITAVPLVAGLAGAEGNVHCKQVEFFAKNGTAWIVSDECVLRQAGRNRPPYVATVYDVTENSEDTAPAGMSLSDRWSKADRIKRYDWSQTKLPRVARPTVNAASIVTSGHLAAAPEPRYGQGVREDWISIELAGVTGENGADDTAVGGTGDTAVESAGGVTVANVSGEESK